MDSRRRRQRRGPSWPTPGDEGIGCRRAVLQGNSLGANLTFVLHQLDHLVIGHLVEVKVERTHSAKHPLGNMQGHKLVYVRSQPLCSLCSSHGHSEDNASRMLLPNMGDRGLHGETCSE